MLTIRKAHTEEMPSVLKLIKELAVFENEPDAVELTEDDLSSDYNNGLFNCMVAISDSSIVGMALYYNRYSTWKGKTIHLEDLIVTKDYRKKGVGKALLDAVVKKAKEEKLKRVEWNVLDWNTPAINFYKDVGATVFKDWLVVQLDEKGIEKY